MAGELAQDLTARALACLNGVNPVEVPLPTLPLTPQASSSSPPSRLPSADTSVSAALSLNLELQAALREEHTKVEKALIESREALKEAHDRLSRKKSVAITSSSDKFKWSRLVDKFFALEAHPVKLGKRKQTEQELRNKPITWLPDDNKVIQSLFLYQSEYLAAELSIFSPFILRSLERIERQTQVRDNIFAPMYILQKSKTF